MADALAAYAERQARVVLSLRGSSAHAPLGLAKASSNLFRDREPRAKQRLDLSDFNHVLAVNPAEGHVDTEGLVSYGTLVEHTLAQGVMPAVVPQLKNGTLGCLLRLRLKTLPVRSFVAVQHRRFASAGVFFTAMEAACDDPASDFVDGVVFAADDFVLNTGRFVDEAPATSDYGFEQIYHQSLRSKPCGWLTVHDWLWRCDTDRFWCSSQFGADRPWVRRLLGRQRLNSRNYTRWMRWNARWGLARHLARWRGLRHVEWVIQDVDLPLPSAPRFLDFLLAEIGILPIWVCPIRATDPARRFTLYPLAPGVRYLNFGFWDVVERTEPHAPGHFNRLVEQRLATLGGIKSLYSDSYYSRDEFDAAYGMAAYAAVKARYDPEGRLLGLYEKCVQRA